MTTPAEIRNIADLYRILEEQPQWNEALRSRMLSAELLAMPQQLVALRQTAEEHTRQFVELRQTAEENTRQIVALRQTAEEHTRQLEGHTQQFIELRQTAEANTRQIMALRQTAEEHTRQLADQTAAIKELRQIAEENTRQVEGHTRQFVELRQTAEEHTRQLADQTQQFVELRQTAEENARQMAEQTAAIKELRQTAEEHTRQLVEQTAQIKELRQTAEEHSRDLRNHTARMNRMEGDMSDIKGRIAEFQPLRTSYSIAFDLELKPPIVLVTMPELMEIAEQLGLDRDTRRSFIHADLVFTVQDENGQTLYCAVEVSWTVNQRDIDRARRNASLIQQARNRPARAIVYGNRYENNLDWEKVDWVEMIGRIQPEVVPC